ncbi:MAG: recombinase family protein, partial [Mucilaginibacter sp.]|uniref:recombinase family protein n=1 Tax=Mucilaginibacter sp. TaxID=1882438 RepID=UPI0031AADDD6
MAENTLFRTFAKGADASLKAKGTSCVIYTRVSGKEQAENLSLDTQRKACNLYAERAGYNILAYFGGTYESAQTDERKQFTAMITYVKRSKSKVSYIIVYSLERFSRNDNSIWLTNQLRALGIEIVSVTQPIDTSNPSGQMQQKMLFLFGEYDNQLRKQKCTAGMKEMLLRGNWPAHPPLGYD